MTHRTRRSCSFVITMTASFYSTIANVRQKRLIFCHPFRQILPRHLCAALLHPSHPLKLLRVVEITRLYHLHELIGLMVW